MAKAILDGFSHTYFPYGYQISRTTWEDFEIPRFEAYAPHEPLARSVQVARGIASALNERKDFSSPATRPARTGELLTLGLLTDVLRFLVNQYCIEIAPGSMSAGLRHLEGKSDGGLQRVLRAWMALFPPDAVLRGGIDADTFLARGGDEMAAPEAAARELMLLALFQENPAAAAYRPLHDDAALEARSRYRQSVLDLEQYFRTQPPHPLTGESLLDLLRAPMKASPDSLAGQLEFVRRRWRHILPQRLFERLLLAQDVLREEERMRGMGGPGPQVVLEFRRLADYPEPEAFSIDKDWMPNVVLIAKTVFVWMDQLSRQYQRAISHLDQIPDEELERLSRWGVNGLWLIGLWERSRASQTIKELMGNKEAAASAYSLYDYVIAHELGGEPAYRDLAARAWRYGIRLASDMVPNHVGIYSRWVVEHPDWFIQLQHPPYPGYRFSGQNLSSEERVGLYIEDGYWDRSDAAVVFKRVDHWTGDTRYIYHGNDGTSMPWNDTAQLNYLLAEVREAVIQTILHVARRFPIIRFDAAMTLAKKHYQRLWFPPPGEGGGIPSRAEHSMSREEFESLFPVEFWRQVVDRVAEEAPDTLLLAEAFWLMEGYFVRTLGMHRVYNSAFMNMLKMEDNANYRQTVKNVLEFSPAVLQRFVNFMNNPDEDTAVAQFGKGDKYFGVAVLMVTMPGLPMLGHGQIEGFTEKYGMEFRRAYWHEEPDLELIRRHEREIFPLMRRRYLFSGAHHFAFYDFVTPDGWVDENVFVYSNKSGDERALILYNNGYNATRGTMYQSTAINIGKADAPQLAHKTLAQALDLNLTPTCYYVIRDQRTGLEYLRHGQRIAEHGLRLELQGYQYYAFTEWREVFDSDLSWAKLDAELADAGVPSVADAYQEMTLASVIGPMRRLLRSAVLRDLKIDAVNAAALRDCFAGLLEAIAGRLHTDPPVSQVCDRACSAVPLILDYPAFVDRADLEKDLTTFLLDADEAPAGRQRVLLLWSLLRHLGAAALPAAPGGSEPSETRTIASARRADVEDSSAAWLQEWYLLKQISAALLEMGGDAWQAEQDARLVRLSIGYGRYVTRFQEEIWGPMLDRLFSDSDTERFLLLNKHDGRRWINKEQLERLMRTLFLTQVVAACPLDAEERDRLTVAYGDVKEILQAAEDTGYDLDWMLAALK